MKKTTQAAHYSLQKQILRYLTYAWFLPLIVMLVFSSVILTRRVVARNDRSLLTSMDSGSRQTDAEIAHCMECSLNASYGGEIQEAWSAYQTERSAADLYAAMNSYLTHTYKFESGITLAAVVFTDLPSNLYVTIRESALEETISLSDFRNNDLPKVIAASEDLGTDMRLVTCESNGRHVYLVRNLLDADYESFATLILGLDCSSVFSPLSSVWQEEAMAVESGGSLVYTANTDATDEEALAAAAAEETDAAVFLYRYGGKSYVISQQMLNGIPLIMMVRYSTGLFHYEVFSTVGMIIIIGIMGFVLAMTLLRFIRTRITDPITRLEAATGKIAAGEFGTHVATDEKCGEVNDLALNFNDMSDRLKEQNRKIYVEEIALRDANLTALQSQINPHFLNNTLEIINWQSRMSGDEKASLMIEALSTMLNATMNRDHRSEVPLSEEMEYAHAYHFIIQSRFGERLAYKEDIDQNLMNIPVPRLVIQPIMENAVEHGTQQDGTCAIQLKVQGSADDFVIEVWNKGVPTKQDWEKIEKLLDVQDTGKDYHSVEIGIRNVHRRVRMMYAKGSGLSFHEQDGWTISRVRIIRKGGEDEKN